MPLPESYEPEFESVKRLLLEVAQQRSLDALLRLIVGTLAERPHVALVRIWLIGLGDVCSSCGMQATCSDQTHCLHLMASAGRSMVDENANWSRIDGDFRRFPLGVRKVGLVGSTGQPVAVPNIERDSSWIARPDWAKRESILGFGSQPLVYRGEVLGVIAVFTRITLAEEGMVWLRLLADHAATAIVNARAFKAIERLKARLEAENEYLREEVMEAQRSRDLVGKSPAIRNVQRQIELVAPTDANVLILGESGVGKEVVGRAIHQQSKRRNKPMVRVNCASIPRELYESEFFGHMKGAFTGALRNRAGRFEAAHEGTLFLDEVGEIPLELQSKLLRVLQEGQYERVGDERMRQVDVRVIAATNRDLKREVEQGRFRQDLYYRLNVFPIEIPPLRRREQDIPVLAKYLLPAAARRLNRPVPHLTQAHIMKLQNYHWPGNVRELQNVIERAIITMGPAGLHFDIPEHSAEARARSIPHRDGAGSSNEVVPEHEMKRREKDNILAALEQSDWKLYGTGGAAELLGIKPTTLASRMKKFRIEKRR